MRLLVLDPFGGLAGDMLVGALLDLGGERAALDRVLGSLGLEPYGLDLEPVSRRAIGCTRAVFAPEPSPPARHLPEILGLVEASTLSEGARATASAAFRLLAEAEAEVHRIGPEEVHFHEVGATDSILDICAVAHLVDALGVERVHVTELPTGRGTVSCDHGEVPALAPATASLLRGFPLVAEGQGEMVTPTAAALVRVLATPLPPGLRHRVDGIGYGAGSRSTSIARVLLGEATAPEDGRTEGVQRETIQVLETHLDDMTGESLAFLLEELMAAGALDVAYHPLVMKKGRPGWALTCLGAPADTARLRDLIFRHSTTLGIRERLEPRTVLPRSVERVTTPHGDITVKVAGERARPEYEDCARAARVGGTSLEAVREEVRRARGPAPD